MLKASGTNSHRGTTLVIAKCNHSFRLQQVYSHDNGAAVEPYSQVFSGTLLGNETACIFPLRLAPTADSL